MTVSLNPKSEKVKRLCEKHGVNAWVILRNYESHKDVGGKPAAMVCKNNTTMIVPRDEIL